MPIALFLNISDYDKKCYVLLCNCCHMHQMFKLLQRSAKMNSKEGLDSSRALLFLQCSGQILPGPGNSSAMEKQFRLGECFPRELTKRDTLEHAPRARAHKKCR